MTGTAIATILRATGGDLLPATPTHDIRFEIPSSDGRRMYVVARRSGGVHAGRVECGCAGWVRHRTCKHLKAMEATGALRLIENAGKETK